MPTLLLPSYQDLCAPAGPTWLNAREFPCHKTLDPITLAPKEPKQMMGGTQRTGGTPPQRPQEPAHRGVIQDDVTAAHVAVKNVLLQVLDEGALGRGRDAV